MLPAKPYIEVLKAIFSPCIITPRDCTIPSGEVSNCDTATRTPINVPNIPIEGNVATAFFERIFANGNLGHKAPRKTYKINPMKTPEIGSLIGAIKRAVTSSVNSKAGA